MVRKGIGSPDILKQPSRTPILGQSSNFMLVGVAACVLLPAGISPKLPAEPLIRIPHSPLILRDVPSVPRPPLSGYRRGLGFRRGAGVVLSCRRGEPR